jgi:hypothetical protein
MPRSPICYSKLETLYPGKFEVINYGIGAGGLLDQIISVNQHFKFATHESSYYLPLVNPARYETHPHLVDSRLPRCCKLGDHETRSHYYLQYVE